MKKYSFFVNDELKMNGTKSEIFPILNKSNCLSSNNFDVVDEKGVFSYYSNGHCVLKSDFKK